jgi:hypothetical protein
LQINRSIIQGGSVVNIPQTDALCFFQWTKSQAIILNNEFNSGAGTD